MNNRFFIRSKEEAICPCCGESLMVKDSRNRHCLNGKGDRIELRIRRLKCRSCGKIHTELPDFIQPFKRYIVQVIEAVIDQTTTSCPAEGSTMRRWKQWFGQSASTINGILMAATLFFTREAIPLMVPTSLLQLLRDTGSGWLKKTIRQVVNSGNWPLF